MYRNVNNINIYIIKTLEIMNLSFFEKLKELEIIVSNFRTKELFNKDQLNINNAFFFCLLLGDSKCFLIYEKSFILPHEKFLTCSHLKTLLVSG